MLVAAMVCGLAAAGQTLVPGDGCIDPTDLTASYTQCSYGTFSNPRQHTGRIAGRHTVQTNIHEYDIRTGGQLRTVPEGATASVRLGNWQTGKEAESITYALRVNSREADLLILKYAAVLQDPKHSSSEQPRFRLELLNANNQLINPTCGMVDFIANSSLGWNTAANNVLWKDWTTVGIDLAPYEGQVLYIRLTTYDCSQGAHYGYAYFTLECHHKNMTTSSCGNVPYNTFSAPSGFSYQWYAADGTTCIGTGQSITVPTDNNANYRCHLSFIDKPGCSFDMNAYAGARFPLALFDTAVGFSNCALQVAFSNRSAISTDRVNPLDNGERCEEAWWDFGNGTTSTQYNPTATYTAPGTYLVTLVASIAGGACRDTVRQMVRFDYPVQAPHIEGPDSRCGHAPADTLRIVGAVASSWADNRQAVAPMQTTSYTVVARDSMNCPHNLDFTLKVLPDSFRDTVASACDLFVWYGDTLRYPEASAVRLDRNSAGCDSTTTLRLDLRQSTGAVVYDTVVENRLPVRVAGQYIRDSISHATLVTTNRAGCDSIIDYSLHVHWNVDTTLYDTLCHSALPYRWNSVGFDTARMEHPVTLTRRTVVPTHVGSDSTITMHLRVQPVYHHHRRDTICDNRSISFGPDGATYNLAGTYTDSLRSAGGCDSLSTLHLALWPTYAVDAHDTLCGPTSMRFIDSTYSRPGDYAHLLATRQGCDSLVTLHLAQVDIPTLYLDSTIDCKRRGYRIAARTDVPYIRWHAYPAGDDLDRHTLDTAVFVAPTHNGTRYVATVDYHAARLCPVADSLVLSPLPVPEALLRVSPAVADPDKATHFEAHDLSQQYRTRTWYIDWERQPEEDRLLRRNLPVTLAEDSLLIALSVDNGTCIDTAQHLLRIVRNCIFAPNVFTPDLDNNNRFVLGALGVVGGRLLVYDRSGRLVHRAEDYRTGWDGCDPAGRACPQASYVWYLEYQPTEAPTTTRTATGTVLLLR